MVGWSNRTQIHSVFRPKASKVKVCQITQMHLYVLKSIQKVGALAVFWRFLFIQPQNPPILIHQNDPLPYADTILWTIPKNFDFFLFLARCQKNRLFTGESQRKTDNRFGFLALRGSHFKIFFDFWSKIGRVTVDFLDLSWAKNGQNRKVGGILPIARISSQKPLLMVNSDPKNRMALSVLTSDWYFVEKIGSEVNMVKYV